MEKPNRLFILRLVQVREGGRTFSRNLNEVKKQADFSGPGTSTQAFLAKGDPSPLF